MTEDIVIQQFGKVGVLLGGRSTEREISLMSGYNILKALRIKGINAHTFDLSEHDLTTFIAEKFDRIFIALHGRYGEDGTIQGVLEQLNIPYTGPGVTASAIAIDKIMTKRIWLACNLPTPRFMIFDTSIMLYKELYHILDILGLPVMLKAPRQGSTIGTVKVASYCAMQAGFSLCVQYDKQILVEEFIIGRELTVPVLGYGHDVRALPVIEICAPQGNYSYQHKYFDNITQYICPAPLNKMLTQRIQMLAIKSFNALGCRGWARVDFMLRLKDNEPFLLEINTSPGMTEHSLVPMSAKRNNISYADLCIKILKMAALDTQFFAN